MGRGVRLSTFIKEELTGWKPFDVGWFAFCCLTVLALSLYWRDTLMGVISAVTGIAYTMGNGLGKRSAYLFGMINSVLYALISLEAGYYGEAMLNGLYYFPMMFVGLALWQKNLNRDTFAVKKRKMTLGERVVLVGAIGLGTFLYGLLLLALGGNLPFVDSFTTVTSVIALIIAVNRFMEQWPLWTVVNGVTIVMWAIHFFSGGESIATLVMWAVYFANGIIMYVKWSKELRVLS